MISFDLSRPLRIILVGRVAIDFNPTDYNRPLSESANFNKYLGGSPANIAKLFGGNQQYFDAVKELETMIYSDIA